LIYDSFNQNNRLNQIFPIVQYIGLMYWTSLHVFLFFFVGNWITHRWVRQVLETRWSAISQQGEPQALRVLTPFYSWFPNFRI